MNNLDRRDPDREQLFRSLNVQFNWRPVPRTSSPRRPVHLRGRSGNHRAPTYHLLGLQTYFTAGEKEGRAGRCIQAIPHPRRPAWIHSDFERGFFKAGTVAYDDLVACGSIAAAREKGVYRMEGKDYVVADGDVLLFKFNV